MPVSRFLNVTDAPGTTAPVGSVTIPAMFPVVEVCAWRLEIPISENTNTKTVSLYE
jgi:hypothetical protein